ncbi:MAG: Asp-tRNA(Asn)/Glu-tRNA(Gln) amidotransferase subunit GatA [Gammaproteobacteria bacterium]|nr:Asp-tRNA(Asn)/Glu-tRNA(Gln) amidotransferase subunit GatA [Gammaproteobacteria bacterium]MDH3534720.1 Asp-tRNA(Asn)/Glu-tRNA(Gln) amidotransferase subunit GatA [Gammaproteobacteria bacterium]
MSLGVNEIRRGLAKGKFSSVEITRDYLARIARYNPTLNCFISVTDEIALAQARAADAALAKGNAGTLTGVPLAHKDLFCTDGVRTSCASRILDNFIAPYDATVVANFKRDGAVMLGKTNMDEFAMGSSNENSYYGSVANPWNTGHVPGGSSGGSAAAVAAGLAPGATGTDTGGSIRQPAALCGVTGIKPTYGRVSRYGMIAYGSSLDQGGPFARSAEDCALLLQTMSGFDARDSTSSEQAVPDFGAALGRGIDGLRIGLPKEYFADGLDGRIAAVIETAIGELRRLGADIRDISLPNTRLSIPTYYVVAMAECSSNLARFDGVRFGYRCENPVDLEDLYKRSRGEGFGAEVKRRIMIGTYALSAGYYDAYYLKAQQLRRMIKDDFQQAFTDVDLILGPTTPEVAFRIGAKTDDPVSMYLQDIYTISLNLAGLPGMSLPVGFVDGLPVGMQLIGNYFDEAGLLNAAHSYQQVTDWHLQAPELEA